MAAGVADASGTFAAPSADTTVVVQELASHGYVVVTVDHTYDAFSEFPDGRLAVPLNVTVIAPGAVTLSLSGSASGPGGAAMGLRFTPVTVTVQ